jgi:hypothetical protein
MNGFSERDLPAAIGHVLGLRWFQLDTRLKEVPIPNPDFMDITRAIFSTPYMTHESVHVPVLRGARDIWEPGVNRARCLSYVRRTSFVRDKPHTIGGKECLCGALEAEPPPRHETPVRECLCGFWAYWRLGAQQASAPHIAALVKGYGKVIQGSEGFRCQTAEIVALVPLVYEQAEALALEQTYRVPVYSSIGALLEMHKAPPTQQPLGDDFFRSYTPPRQERYGGKRNHESYTGYARRIGFLPAPSLPCTTCGVTGAVRTGQSLCDPCLGTTLLQAGRDAAERMRGITAQAELHARRESWVKDAPSVYGWLNESSLIPAMPPSSFGFGFGFGFEGSSTPFVPRPSKVMPGQQADTSAIRYALDYMKNKFGDGSWWRSLQKPGK